MSSRDRLIVIGGGAAGHTAAVAYREAGGAGEVLLLTREDALPYERPPLSKQFLRGEIEYDDLPLSGAAWLGLRGIEVRRAAEVALIDPERRTVALLDDQVLDYGHCVLATGSRPARPSLPGAGDARVLVLRSLADAERLRAAAIPGRTAIVLGSGFVGCEAASSLAARGLDVTLVTPESVPHAARLGERVGRRIADWLEQDGVRLRLGAQAERIEDSRRVQLPGETLEAELVLLATGARPEATVAARSGIALDGERVPVDARMRSVHEGLLAAGDVAFALHPTAGRRLRVEHWGEALRMGEVAGRTAAGTDDAWDDAPGFWSTIGRRTLKQVAWGDGFDEIRHVDHPGGGFSAWYGREGVTVGVLTHEADADYERGRRRVEGREPLPDVDG